MRRMLLVPCALLLLVLACGGAAESGSEAAVAATRAVRVTVVSAGEMQPVALTRAAEERRRQRAHHATLVASRPTPGAPAAPPAQQLASLHVSGQDTSHYQPTALAPSPGAGVWWYQENGGGRTGKGVRESNPYWPLFEGEPQSGEHPNFADGSMQILLGRQLAQEVYALMPDVGRDNQALEDALVEQLGWELVSLESPLVRLWSDFVFRGPDGRDRKYVVGVVATLEVRPSGAGGERLEPGGFVGPVLLERR